MESVARGEILGELSSALDRYRERLAHVQCVTIVDEMIRDLGAFYDSAARTDTLPQFRAACQMHPLHELVLQDPLTAHAFNKPRGYAGDGAMLDYIYHPRPLSLTDVGAAVHFVTTGVSTANSIRWRRDHLGAQIVKTVKRTRHARILSVANGHLRELDVVRSMMSRRDFEIVALDPDQESLEDAVNSNPDFNITPLNKPISHLLRGGGSTKYDLIHAAATLDCLPDKAASALLRRLIEMLAPSGRLIVGNYAPENYGRGYMEGMMGWTLLYRAEAELEMLLETGREHRVYRDRPGNVVYLEISAPCA